MIFKRKYTFFKIAVLCCSLYLIYKIFLNSYHNSILVRDYEDFLQTRTRTKYVLFYTPLDILDNWSFGNETIYEQYFIDHKCPVTSCIFTRNAELLPKVDLFDALVFHVVGPQTIIWPITRRVHQQYIAAGNESPFHFRRSIMKDNDIFNWIMNYRLDSDLIWVYGSVHDIKTDKRIAPSPQPSWIEPNPNFTDEKYLQLALNKKKLALWMVSNCKTQGQREKLVAELQEYMNVDISGYCADNIAGYVLQCPRYDPLDTFGCNQIMEDDYKFYFAFENSLCEDYVTEKLFRSLSILIVPVVYGGANYTRFAPPHSYINVNDFQNAESLAKYLLYLNDNPLEYIKYFWWKKHYTVQPNDVATHCDICQKVTEEAEILPRSIYKTIVDWWYVGCKMKPNIQFNNTIYP